MPVNFEDLARDFMAHTNPGIVGEVMNLDDFLEELSDPDPKSAVMLNNENSNDNFDGRKKLNYHQHPPNSLEMMFHAASYHPQIQNNSNNIIPNGPSGNFRNVVHTYIVSFLKWYFSSHKTLFWLF